MNFIQPNKIAAFCFFYLLLNCLAGLALEYPRKASEFFQPYNADNKYFLIDSKGKKFQQIKCQSISDFSEGLCAVSEPISFSGFFDGDRGYIDTKGTVVILGLFQRAGDFKNGLAFAKTREGPCYIDKTGKVLFKIGKYDSGFNFTEDLAPFFHETEDLIGVPLMPNDLRMRYGYINKQGKVVIPAEFTWAVEFYEGRAAVRDKEGKWFLIDKTGNPVSKKYNFVTSVSEGLAAVREDKKWGFIDTTGKEIIPLKFDAVDKFSENLAFVKAGSKCGVIDKKGNLVIEPCFKNGGHFVNGLSPAQNEDGKWGYINTKGNYVIKPIYDWAEPFSSKRAAVTVDKKVGYIDETGKYICEPTYKEGKPFHGDVAIVIEGPPDKPRKVIQKTEKSIFWQFWNKHDRPGSFDIASNASGWQTSATRIKSSPDRKYILVFESIAHRRNGVAGRINLMDGKGKEILLKFCSEIDSKNKNRRSEIHGYSWSPDSNKFAWAETNGVYIYNIASSQKKEIEAFENGALDCLWSPDGKYIAAGESIAETTKLEDYGLKKVKLKVFDVQQTKIVFEKVGPYFSRIAWSPDSKYLLFSGKKVEIFEPGKNWKLFATVDGAKGSPMVWSPDSRYIAFSDIQSSWVRTFEKSGKFVNKYPAESPYDISWSKDGKVILAREESSGDKYTTIKLNFKKNNQLVSAPRDQAEKSSIFSSNLKEEYKSEWFAKPGKQPWGHGISKEKIFEKIRTDYPLIGMKRSELLDLLGTPDDRPRVFYKDSKEIVYRIFQTGCINEGVWLVFEIENDKVKRWTRATTFGKRNWVTENPKKSTSSSRNNQGKN